MKITDVTTILLNDPEGPTIQDATIFSPGLQNIVSVYVIVKTDEGLEGLGTSEGGRPVKAVVDDSLRRVLVGEDPMNTERIWNRMFWTVRSGGRKGIAINAMSAVDIALWDLKAKALGLPLYKLLGAYSEATPVYGSGGWTNFTTEELVAEQMSYVERGFTRIKLKVGKDFGQAEEEDLRRLAAVRQAAGPDVEIYVDANNGYYARQAIRMSRAFEDYNVKWFEEPVLADDIEGLAAVSRATTIPVATGEHEWTKFGFKELMARGAADIVQPDIGRVGGVTEWIKVANMAQAFNLPVASHGYQEVHLHVACAIPNMMVVEYLGLLERRCRLFYKDFPEPRAGMWAPYPDRPGLGLELSPWALEHLRVG